MKRYSCVTHSIIILIPDTKKEFHEGKYHQDIEKCVNHIKEFPDCKFKKLGEES
jgi:hypothetical protein